MPSFITHVENQPIVLGAFLQKVTNHELQDAFKTVNQYVKQNRRIVGSKPNPVVQLTRALLEGSEIN